MTHTFRDAVRAIKPEKKSRQFKPRTEGSFLPADAVTIGRSAVILDTNVYIRNAQGSLPAAAANILDHWLQFHSSVCLGEIAIGVSAYSPSATGYAATRNYYEALVQAIPDTRILTPDAQIWIEAGLVAGVLARTQKFQPHQRKECMNDALIYLTAEKNGLPVLTADRTDFDLIQQVVGSGSFIYF